MLQNEKDLEQSEPLVARPNEDKESSLSMQKRTLTTKQLVSIFVLGVLGASLLWSLVVIVVLLTRSQSTGHEKEPSDTINLLYCGDTPEEARAMGCKFQIHTFAWVPEPCYDEVLQQEWLEVRDWEYYTDKYDQGEQVNISVALAGERDLYSTWGQHIEHCAFTWRKFTRTQSGSGVLLTNRDLSYEHVHHCSDALRTKFDHPWEEVNTRVKVEYHLC